MTEVLARPKNNAEPFCGQRKGGKFKCENFTTLFPGLHEIFGLNSRTNFSFLSFVLMWYNRTINFVLKK